MTDDYKTNETEWNQAIAFHMRIDKALRLAQEMSFKQDFQGWLRAILMFKRELEPWMNTKEALEIKGLEHQATSRINAKNVNDNVKYKYINDLERALREVFHRTGMDLPQKSDPRRALRG